jgi:MFS family permease
LKKPFYGWVIVGVCFLIGATEASAFQNILSIFMKPMVFEFGWSRASVTGAIAFGSICGGLLAPAVGPVLDRHGPKLVAFGGVLILSMGLFGMMFLSSLWQFYLFFGLGRMIAMGVLGLVISVTVPKWFVDLRGRALGVTWLGPRFGGVLLPPLVQFIILAEGWRTAWSILAVVVFLMSGIPSLLFLRRRPEDMGLLPDGVAPVSDRNESAINEERDRMSALVDNTEPVWTRSQAMHTRTFWMLTLMHSLLPFMNAGINFHIYPFLTDQGIREVIAVMILSTIAVFGAVGSVVWGTFAEKVRIQGLMAANVFVNGLVFLLLYWVVLFQYIGGLGIGTVFFLAALHGLFHGGRMPMLDVFWAKFFGRRHLGSIYSFSSPFRLSANAVGPVFAALCFDLFGSYVIPFYLFGAIFFIVGVISMYMKSPRLSAEIITY